MVVGLQMRQRVKLATLAVLNALRVLCLLE